jgi:hypothetical protein
MPARRTIAEVVSFGSGIKSVTADTMKGKLPLGPLETAMVPLVVKPPQQKKTGPDHQTVERDHCGIGQHKKGAEG